MNELFAGLYERARIGIWLSLLINCKSTLFPLDKATQAVVRRTDGYVTASAVYVLSVC